MKDTFFGIKKMARCRFKTWSDGKKTLIICFSLKPKIINYSTLPLSFFAWAELSWQSLQGRLMIRRSLNIEVVRVFCSGLITLQYEDALI